ncbi:MAG: hypothetical protein OXF66_10955 [Gammaproteobacteria bacterium]|nr:hypothetical protein [Gammaproteobacteria bacterium]
MVAVALVQPQEVALRLREHFAAVIEGAGGARNIGKAVAVDVAAGHARANAQALGA